MKTMNIEVEHMDSAGAITHHIFPMTLLAFAKHLGFAGQGYSVSKKKLIRTISMFLHYSQYIQRNKFYNGCFSEPSIALSDPTEKGHFSNLAGKAIADFLSKQIDRSVFTVNYEAAMRLKKMPIKNNPRPDLLAYKQNIEAFAIEAKGYSGGCGDMTEHKKQSQTGGIPVSFSVACVSYNLYNRVHCKYYDPFNDNILFNDEKLFRELTRNYYKGLLEFLDSVFFDHHMFEHQGETFYEVELLPSLLIDRFSDENPLRKILFDYFILYRLRLILPGRIEEYAKFGLTSETTPFLFETSGQEYNMYIDNDRVGLRIKQQ